MKAEDVIEQAITAVVEHCNGAAYLGEEWARVNARAALQDAAPYIIQEFLERCAEESWWGAAYLNVLMRRAKDAGLTAVVDPARKPAAERVEPESAL